MGNKYNTEYDWKGKARHSESTDYTFLTPNECLEALVAYNAPFRDAVRQKCRFDDIPLSMKEDIIKLVEYCSPDIDYDIKKVFCVLGNNEPGYKYRLNILSSAEEISVQADVFYSQVKDALTDPLFKKGVTPNFALDLLVDRYSQEAGVDDNEEIARITSRLMQRLFNDDATAENTSHCISDAAPDAIADIDDAKSDERNISEITRLLKAKRKNISDTMTRMFEAAKTPRAGIVARLARWISLPAVKIEVAEERQEAYIDEEAEKLIIPFPKVSYSIKTQMEDLMDVLRPFMRIIEHFSKSPILKTSATALKSDLAQIPILPAQDISISLRRIIERNFNVKLIEITSEDDKYATPEYFNVSRAKIDRVTTTNPSVVCVDGQVLVKGIYLVPLDKSQQSDNNLTIF